MIVEVYKCPQCGKEARIGDLDDSPIHKILLLCLECRDAPVMEFQHTQITDAEGNVGTVII